MESPVYWIAFALTMLLQGFLSCKRRKMWGVIIPLILFLVIAYIAVVTTINYTRIPTSFPLDAYILINVLEYLPPLILSIIIYFICRLVRKKSTV